MRLLQFTDGARTRVARADDNGMVAPLQQFASVYELARAAITGGRSVAQQVETAIFDAPLPYAELLEGGRLLPPLTHPDPAHCLVSGTGLTHLGSAAARDAMHQKLQGTAELTDSMKMFKWGLEGGKPEDRRRGVQGEW